MSTLGWIALVLVVPAVALVLWMMARRARGTDAGSPRTVADLVRLRAERAGAVEPLQVVLSPAVVVPEPGAVVEEAPAEGKPVDVAPPATEGRHAAPIRVPASADDTPWNRAARIAENAGIVWATDHSRPARVAEVSPEPVLRPVQLPAFPPDLVATRSTVQPATPDQHDAGSTAPEGTVTSEAAEAVAAEPVAVEHMPPASVSAEPAATGSAAAETATVEVGRRVAEPARPRRSPAETAAEQAAADLALLRTFGCADPTDPDDDPSTVLLAGACCAAAAPAATPGAAQTVAFHVVGRDGAVVPGAGVTLLDDRGGEAAGAVTDGEGRGTVLAPHPGSYVLVSAANGHQPGAVAITVAAAPVSADLLLARSASLSGVVHGEDGPVVGARLTLVQGGEIVDTADSGPGGAYRIADLAAGEYGLSVTAAECEPVAVLVTVPDETDLHQDIELEPVGLNRPADDVMIGLS